MERRDRTMNVKMENVTYLRKSKISTLAQSRGEDRFERESRTKAAFGRYVGIGQSGEGR